MQVLTIVVPAYNEASTIHLILDKVLVVSLIGGLSKEILVVDDHSVDGTYEAVNRYLSEKGSDNIRVLRHP